MLVGTRTATRPIRRRLFSSSSSYSFTAAPAAATPVDTPEQAEIVVVGGGIIGASVAYHLAKHGARDVVLLEKDKVTSGTTWHAAGLMVTFGSTSETSTALRKYSKELYGSVLEEETGQPTGFKPCGFIELATHPDRVEEFRRVSAFNRKCGVDVQEIGPDDIRHLFPACRTDDVLRGFYVEDDGRVNPYDATMALVKGARLHGCRIFEDTPVSGITTSEDRSKVTGVTLADGRTIRADTVVNCAGMWARQFAAKAGVVVPNQAAEHYYLVTDPIDEIDPEWPVIEDPSAYTYIRPEGAGLMVGLFETEAAAWNVGAIPESGFEFGEITPDWDRMAPFLEAAMNRVPVSLEAGVKTFFCGPESFTPDLAPVLGESPELRDYWVAAGMNSIGILTGGGIGNLMAQWILSGDRTCDEYDITGFNIDRFQRFQCNPQYRGARVEESLGLVYKLHYPNRSLSTARNNKKSPIHERLAKSLEAGGPAAYFKDVSGWEGADWYGVEPSGEKYQEGDEAGPLTREGASAEAALTWGKAAWFDKWAAEHKACREGVVLVDMSFMSKFLVQGGGAGRLLNRLSTANVDGNEGEITYTQWLNSHGKLEADLTVCKLNAQECGVVGGESTAVGTNLGGGNCSSTSKYLVVATDTAHRHVRTWIERQGNEVRGTDSFGEDYDVTITDVTGGLAQINLQGPRSRELMEALVACPGHDDVPPEDMSNEGFPFRCAREIAVGLARVLCVRITYLGELGYELYVPAEQATHVYDQIIAADTRAGTKLVHCGLKALGSLRMEKGYRDYGHDLDNTDTLLESGLGFTADYDKDGGFIGKEAVLEQKAGGIQGLRKRIAQVLVKDPEPMLYHAEVVLRDGVVVGDVRAGSYGHTLGGSVGLTMLERDDELGAGGDGLTWKKWIDSGTWEVDIAGVKYPAEVSLRPMYDPTNSAIRA